MGGTIMHAHTSQFTHVTLKKISAKNAIGMLLDCYNNAIRMLQQCLTMLWECYVCLPCDLTLPVLHVFAWLCLRFGRALFPCFSAPFLPVFACPCLSFHVFACPCLSLPVSACLCLSLHVFACPCLSLHVFACASAMPVLACLCLSLPVFACLCLSMPVFACLSLSAPTLPLPVFAACFGPLPPL
jgi:hypothetical protein